MARKGASIPINVKVTTDQGEPPPQPKDLGPLFSFEGEAAEIHAKTRVFRIEPIDEGHLDDIPPDADRKDVKRRWGGGTYRVQAVTDRGKILSTDSNVKISGDPIFDNEVSRRRYDKWISQQFGADKESRATDGDKEDAQDARHRRELARLRTELEAKDAAEERRRQREREDRRAEAEEREAREEARRTREAELRREEREAERVARREEMQERLAHEERIAKADRELRIRELDAKGDPVQTMSAMAQIALALRGDGGGDGSYPDAVTAAAARLPEILREVREGEREAKGGGSDDDDGDDKLTLAGGLAQKAKRLVRQLAKQGKSEEEIERILGTGMDALMRMRTLPQGARRPAATAGSSSTSAAPKNGATKKRKGWRPLKAAKPKPPKKKIAPKPAAKDGAAS